MSDTPVWRCEIKAFDGTTAVALTELTVGAKFGLNCTGDLAVDWQGTPKIQMSDKTPPHTLDMLEVRRLEPNAAELIVTSYRAGEHKPEYVRVVGDKGGFEVANLEWKIQTVVKSESGQPPQPYGPIGPFSLAIPVWVWGLLTIIVALMALTAVVWARRLRRKRKLRDDLARYGQSGPPAAQFQKELRTIGRKLLSGTDNVGEWNGNLDQAIRIYLMREFEFLTLGESRRRLYKMWRRANRSIADLFVPGLKKIFSEMDRFQAHAAQHKPDEFGQILSLARSWNDQIEKQKVKRR